LQNALYLPQLTMAATRRRLFWQELWLPVPGARSVVGKREAL